MDLQYLASHATRGLSIRDLEVWFYGRKAEK